MKVKRITIIIMILTLIGAGMVWYFNLQSNNQNESFSFVSGEIISINEGRIVIRAGSVDLSTNKAGQNQEAAIYYNDQTLVNKTLPGYGELVLEEISKITEGSIISAEYEVSSDGRFIAKKIILINE